LRGSLLEFHSSRLDRGPTQAAKGAVLARHEGDFRTEAKAPLSLDELLALLGNGVERERQARDDAIACYLSGGEGWRDAARLLGGTFAAEAETGLKESKTD
jgi:hypothetical protein